MGRIRAAIAVLLGRQQTNPQMQAEWAEMKADFLQAYKKLNALTARMAKEHKELVEAQQAELEGSGQDQPCPEDLPPKARKALLRRQVFGGGARPTPTSAPHQEGIPARNGRGRWVPADEHPDAQEEEEVPE